MPRVYFSHFRARMVFVLTLSLAAIIGWSAVSASISGVAAARSNNISGAGDNTALQSQSAEEAVAPTTQLSMSGEPGDYIGGPTDYLYKDTDGTFGAQASDRNHDGVVDYVGISFTQQGIGGHWWYLNFSTDRLVNKNLEPGFYDNAQREPFADAGHPGLSVYGDGRGCNTLTGNFTVHEAVYDYSNTTSPKVVSFTASFEQHCEGGTAALLGTIYYNYTGSQPTFGISGQVVDMSGAAVANVPVKLSASQTATTTTDANGNYSFTDLLSGGNYRVTPTATSSYVFSPTTRTLKRLASNQTANFTAVPIYSISGQVKDANGAAITGVFVSLTGSQTAQVFTDNSGNYSFTGLRADGNYTVTPSRNYYNFSPPSQTFNTLNGNQTLNFTGTVATYSLGGRVINELGTGMSGVTVNLSGSKAAVTQTDANGNYSFKDLPAGGNYQVAPNKKNYNFGPPSQGFFGLNGNWGSVNFTGFLVNYSIGGLILDSKGDPVAGVTVALSGSRTGTTTSASNGSYSFTNLPAEGTYTVTPAKNGYAFSPQSRTFVNLDANQSGNFVASPVGLQLSSSTYSINEGEASGVVLITVNRSGDTSTAITVDYSTSDQSGTTPCQTNTSGIASDRCDYATAVGTLRFAAGETSKTIQIPIIDDVYQEPTETFTVTLKNAKGASLGTASAVVSINDNDTGAATQNPIDNQDFFIKQQYLDFLGRVAEADGLAFWKNRMNNCPVGDTCDRIDTSKRFFQSDEFQERGFYVYRLYDALLGRLPLYSEFVPDTARLSGYQTVTEQRQNKDAYLLDFLNKTEFRNLYGAHVNTDGTLVSGHAAAFVDALCQTAGITPAAKQTLIDNLANGTKDPAHTIEDFILTPEMSGIGTKFYDRGFITMQYFGYLRRDPDAGGFNFWVSQLMGENAPHKQDYRFMIGGFLQSDEYCFRFAMTH